MTMTTSKEQEAFGLVVERHKSSAVSAPVYTWATPCSCVQENVRHWHSFRQPIH